MLLIPRPEARWEGRSSRRGRYSRFRLAHLSFLRLGLLRGFRGQPLWRLIFEWCPPFLSGGFVGLFFM